MKRGGVVAAEWFNDKERLFQVLNDNVSSVDVLVVPTGSIEQFVEEYAISKGIGVEKVADKAGVVGCDLIIVITNGEDKELEEFIALVNTGEEGKIVKVVKP